MKQLNKVMINSKFTLWIVMVLLVASTGKIHCQERITTTYYPVASNNRGIINDNGFFSVNSNLQVGRLVGYKYIGYLEFDIQEIPKYAIVNSAKIKLLSDKDFGQITVKHLGKFISFANPKTTSDDLYTGTTIANNDVTNGGNYAISDSEILKVVNNVKNNSLPCNFSFIPDVETRYILHNFSLSSKYCYLNVDYTLPAPPKPTNVTVSNVTTNSCKLSWKKPSGDIPVKGYEIYLNETLYSTTSSTSINIDGLESSTKNSISIRAYNNYGNSGYVTKSVLTIPSTPTNLVVTKTDCTSAKLEWDFVNGSNVTYNVYNYGDFIGNVVDNNKFNLSDIDVPSNNSYKVAATNSTGSSGYSNYAKLSITSPINQPIAPSSSYVLDIPSIPPAVVFWWNDIKGVDGYKFVQVMPDYIEYYTTSNSKYFTLDYFIPGKTYIFSVFSDVNTCFSDRYNFGFGVAPSTKSASTTRFEEYGDIQWLELPTHNDEIELYPNPIENTLNIQGEYEKVQIFSSTGNLVLDKKNTNNSIDMSYVDAGIYVVKIYTASGIVVKKIVKK